VILFSILAFRNLHELGIYPDAINPDYISVHIFILHARRSPSFFREGLSLCVRASKML
jgi:hypothetical protein